MISQEEINFIEELGSSGVILTAFAFGLVYFYKTVVKYIEQKRQEDQEEKEYYRDKINKKDEKIEKITQDFSEILNISLRSLKEKVEVLTKEVMKK